MMPVGNLHGSFNEAMILIIVANHQICPSEIRPDKMNGVQFNAGGNFKSLFIFLP
jgi:hypothetical protein